MIKKIVLLLSIAIFGVSFACTNKEEKPEIIKNSKPVYSYEEKLKSETIEIRSFLGKSPKYNSNIVFLLDMKIESGKNRFFIYKQNTQ